MILCMTVSPVSIYTVIVKWLWLTEFYTHTIYCKQKQKQKSSVIQTIYEGWLCGESHVPIRACQQTGDSRSTSFLKASHAILDMILRILRWFLILAMVLRKMPSRYSRQLRERQCSVTPARICYLWLGKILQPCTHMLSPHLKQLS